MPTALTRLGLGFACLAAVACGGDGGREEGTRSDPRPEEEVALVDLGPGDCFTGIALGSGESASATTVMRLPCGEPHDHEVFHAFEFGSGGRYPGEEEVIQLSGAGCQDAFALGVGNTDALDQISIWPTAASWAEGDRTVLCAAFARDGDQLVGNIR